MPRQQQNTWSGSLHQTFRLLPEASAHLVAFLESDGCTPDEVLARLPYDKARSRGSTRDGPDPKRYRDCKQIYQTAGLTYEGRDNRLHITELGIATLRWVDRIRDSNKIILGRHVASALAACQLRNPTGAASRYHESMTVFPFAFIWRAMLALDAQISSDEINRGLFKVKNEEDLLLTIDAIRDARRSGDSRALGEEVISGKNQNDRLIPWMSLASFGWTLFRDKRDSADGYYRIPPPCLPILAEAATIRHRHRAFDTAEEYVKHISRCAALPKDLR